MARQNHYRKSHITPGQLYEGLAVKNASRRMDQEEYHAKNPKGKTSHNDTTKLECYLDGIKKWQETYRKRQIIITKIRNAIYKTQEDKTKDQGVKELENIIEKVSIVNDNSLYFLTSKELEDLELYKEMIKTNKAGKVTQKISERLSQMQTFPDSSKKHIHDLVKLLESVNVEKEINRECNNIAVVIKANTPEIGDSRQVNISKEELEYVSIKYELLKLLIKQRKEKIIDEPAKVLLQRLTKGGNYEEHKRR